MAVGTSKRPRFVPVTDLNTQQNFDEVTKHFVELYPGVWAREQEVTLGVGDTSVRPSTPRPRGRLITFQTAASDIFDRGLQADGTWTFNSSAACTIRVAFF